jgi:gluconate 2-dehydrogenase gamma chain
METMREKNTEMAGAGELATDFLDPAELKTLAAVCARLIPEPGREPFLGIAKAIHHRLAAENAGTWHGSASFLDGTSLRSGLRSLNELARKRLRRDFAEVDGVRQEQILASVRNGSVRGDSWEVISPKRFIDALVRESNEIYQMAPVTEEAV